MGFRRVRNKLIFEYKNGLFSNCYLVACAKRFYIPIIKYSIIIESIEDPGDVTLYKPGKLLKVERTNKRIYSSSKLNKRFLKLDRVVDIL